MTELDDLVYKWKRAHSKVLELAPRLPYDVAAKIAIELMKICREGKSFAKDQPASQKQLDLMRRLKIPVPNNCTMGTAHDLIAKKLKESKNA